LYGNAEGSYLKNAYNLLSLLLCTNNPSLKKISAIQGLILIQFSTFNSMIQLEKFTRGDFDRFISWIDSEEELVQFAGPLFTYPLSQRQLELYLTQQKKSPYRIKLIETNEIIGHCELNFENKVPRLSRILIGEKSLRNKGIGTYVVHEMIALIFSTTIHTAIDLNVFDWNNNAITCYEKIGFKIRPELRSSMLVSGKNWYALNMILSRDDYFASGN
jgi:RimJ/RimL family protein N-acetyltransferase